MDYEDILQNFDEAQIRFFFGNEFSARNEKIRRDNGDDKSVYDKIDEETLLFDRRSLLRLSRYDGFHEGQTLEEIRDAELSHTWTKGPPLMPITHEDPFGLYEVPTGHNRNLIIDAEIRRAVFDVMAVMQPEDEGRQRVLQYLARCARTVENVRDWVQEYAENPRACVAGLIRDSEERMKAQAFFELDRDFVAIDFIKDQLWKMKEARDFDKDHRNIDAESDTSMHMAFVAEKGTGKTTLAAAIGPAMKRLGLLEKDCFVKMSLSSVADTTLGASEKNVRAAFEKGSGGIVFCDEVDTVAGHVSRGQDRSSISQVINELAENNREKTCLIVATYPDMIETFLNSDEGLRSRFGNRILHFPPYTTTNLVQMFEQRMAKKGFSLADNGVRSLVWDHLSAIRKEEAQSFGSGRTVRELAQETGAVLEARMKKSGYSLSGAYAQATGTERPDMVVTQADMKKVFEGFKLNRKAEKLSAYAEENPYQGQEKATNQAQEKGAAPVVALFPKQP